MSFILRSLRLRIDFLRITRPTKCAFKKEKDFCSVRKLPLAVNKSSVRFYVVASQSYPSASRTTNQKEIVFEKFLHQIYTDVYTKGYTYREDVNNALQTLKSSKHVPFEDTAILIKVCGHHLPLETTADKLKLVEDVWCSLEAVGIEKTIAHYNALLDIYIELEHKFSPTDFLRYIKENGLLPNVITYSKLIHALGIQGNINKAKEFLEDMEMNSIRIDARVFNSLILGFSLLGDFKNAHSTLELIKEKGLILSFKSYTMLALGYAKRGDIEKVKEILAECKKEKINLEEKYLLELAYSFAANGHSDHFSSILETMEFKKNFLILSTPVIHRLLHQNLDNEALILLETRDKLGVQGNEQSQMFLNHYVRFRKPEDVLRMAEVFRMKDWTQLSFAYCLKETLLEKDVSHCLDFLETMATKGYPLRIHYFYPVLIKMRQHGNEEVLKIIQHINSHSLKPGREMVSVLENFYDFVPGGELNDLKKLVQSGVDEKLVAWKILDILLSRGDIDNAINLVNTYGIAYPASHLHVMMSRAFIGHEDEPEKFVDIVYTLIHNLKANRIMKKPLAEVNPEEYEVFFIQAAKAYDKTFILAVMKEMLKKKIPLSKKAGSSLSECFPCPEVADLVAQLTAEDLKLKYDKNILNRLNEVNRFRINQKFQEKNLPKLYETLSNIKHKDLLMKRLENLSQETGFDDGEICGNTIGRIFDYASLQGNVFLTENIYRFGVRKNLIREADYDRCVRARLVRGEVTGAVRRFHEGINSSNSYKNTEPLIREILKRNDSLALLDLEILLNKIYGKNEAATKLVVEFAKLGDVAEARKIFQTSDKILKPMFDLKCREEFGKKNVTYFETLEKASRNISSHLTDTHIVYYFLLKLYESSENLEKLLNLYVELVRDDATYGILRRHFWNILENWRGDVPAELKMVLQCVKGDCSPKKNSIYTEAVSYKENIENVEGEDVNPDCDGQSKLMNLSNSKIFKCFCLIFNGKLNQYFTVLKKEIFGNELEKAEDYFFCYKLVPQMKKNMKYFDEYKSLVKKFDSAHLWEKYLKLTIRLGPSEETIEAIKKLTINELKYTVRTISVKDCISVVESLPRYSVREEKLAVFYSKIIDQCRSKKNWTMARKYYEKAKKYKLEPFLENILGKDFLELER